MTIASALSDLNTDIQNARTAITNKGGTVTVDGGSSQLATDIATIPSGGGGTKYGCTVDNLLGNVDANGELQYPLADTSGNIVFTGVKSIKQNYILYRKFANNTNLSHGVIFPDLENIGVSVGESQYCCYEAFRNTGITSVSFPKLKAIYSTADIAFYMFSGCYNLASIYLPELEEIHSGFQYFLTGSSVMGGSLTSVTFDKLNIIFQGGTSASSSTFRGVFQYQPKLAHIYFPAITTSTFGSRVGQFNNMFNSSTGSEATGGCTMHFPSNLATTIAGLSGYPTFGGDANYINLSFDLPATS